MAVLASSAEEMTQNFLAGLSFLPKMKSENYERCSPEFHQRDNSSIEKLSTEQQENRKRGSGGGGGRRNGTKSGRSTHGKKSVSPAERIAPQWCDVCKITLNAPHQLEQHFAGFIVIIIVIIIIVTVTADFV